MNKSCVVATIMFTLTTLVLAVALNLVATLAQDSGGPIDKHFSRFLSDKIADIAGKTIP